MPECEQCPGRDPRRWPEDGDVLRLGEEGETQPRRQQIGNANRKGETHPCTRSAPSTGGLPATADAKSSTVSSEVSGRLGAEDKRQQPGKPAASSYRNRRKLEGRYSISCHAGEITAITAPANRSRRARNFWARENAAKRATVLGTAAWIVTPYGRYSFGGDAFMRSRGRRNSRQPAKPAGPSGRLA